MTDHTEAPDAHCADCRAGRELLDAIPPEAFLDGPPEDAELLLPRTLRRIKEEKAATRRKRTITISAAAAVVALAALGGGIVIGRSSTTQPGVSVAEPADVPGTKQLAGSDSGAKLAATVVPANGWVWVHASVSGIPAGQKCRLVVVSRTGQTEIAGSWLVPDKPGSATKLVGTALVAPADVAAVEVQNLAGHVFVRANT
ncbi:MAG TPA: anti-sigma factor [Pseudonocardiaceae bacterium]|nr:anti-sigma factor [Pseudonocardiaceae bacterium]